MAIQTWVVYAVSRSIEQRVRKFDLANMNQVLDQATAQQHAENFAALQNTNQYMHVSDWQAHIEYESHGEDTIPGYQHKQ
jgi:hypothetical protein